MQTLVNSLAVLAFLGVVLLLFAMSAMLKMIYSLRGALADLRLGTPNLEDRSHRHVPALANDAGAVTFLLVVDGECPACQDRSRHFQSLAGGGSTAGRRLVAVSADERCAGWFTGTGVDFRLDPSLVGHIGVSVTPTLVRYGADGVEQWRRVVGSDADLDRLLSLAPAPGAGAISGNGGAR